MRIALILILSVLSIQASIAQKLVDPDKVAPGFRTAAEKTAGRADQANRLRS
jgi:hypothetical protein